MAKAKQKKLSKAEKKLRCAREALIGKKVLDIAIDDLFSASVYLQMSDGTIVRVEGRSKDYELCDHGCGGTDYHVEVEVYDEKHKDWSWVKEKFKDV